MLITNIQEIRKKHTNHIFHNKISEFPNLVLIFVHKSYKKLTKIKSVYNINITLLLLKRNYNKYKLKILKFLGMIEAIAI